MFSGRLWWALDGHVVAVPFFIALKFQQVNYKGEKNGIVTITNHIRKIQEHADSVIEHVDDRDYARAHVALDYIEHNVCSARYHIEKLQSIAACATCPAGGD